MYLPVECGYENGPIENLQPAIAAAGIVICQLAKRHRAAFRFFSFVLFLLILRETNFGKTLFYPDPEHPGGIPPPVGGTKQPSFPKTPSFRLKNGPSFSKTASSSLSQNTPFFLKKEGGGGSLLPHRPPLLHVQRAAAGVDGDGAAGGEGDMGEALF